MIKSDVPIVGKWYKVIKGVKKGFIGECVTCDIYREDLPIILQDLEFYCCACNIDEIEPTFNQPNKVYKNYKQLKHK